MWVRRSQPAYRWTASWPPIRASTPTRWSWLRSMPKLPLRVAAQEAILNCQSAPESLLTALFPVVGRRNEAADRRVPQRRIGQACPKPRTRQLFACRVVEEERLEGLEPQAVDSRRGLDIRHEELN